MTPGKEMNQEDRAVELFQQNKTYKEIGSELGLSSIKTGMLMHKLRKEQRIGYRNAAKGKHKPITAEIIALRTGDLGDQIRAWRRANNIGRPEMSKMLGVTANAILYWERGGGCRDVNARKVGALISGHTKWPPKSTKTKAPDPIKTETTQDIPYWDTPYWHLDREIMSRDPSKIRHILRALWRHLSPR